MHFDQVTVKVVNSNSVPVISWKFNSFSLDFLSVDV